MTRRTNMRLLLKHGRRDAIRVADPTTRQHLMPSECQKMTRICGPIEVSARPFVDDAHS